MTSTILQKSERFRELDALRGLAAFAVVLRHFVNVFDPASNEWVTFVLRSPLRLFLGAHEAVLLFFVLSGFVLSLSLGKAGGTEYLAFSLKRICRIYLPYVAALLLALLGAHFLAGELAGFNKWFGITWSVAPARSLIIQHFIFIGDYDWAQYNTAFWSLVYEMRISLIFPFIYWSLRHVRTSVVLFIALIMSATCKFLIIFLQTDRWPLTLHYAALFVVGFLLARERTVISGYFNSLTPVKRLAWTVVCVFCLTYGQGFPRLKSLLYPLADWPVVLGASCLIVFGLNAERFRSFLLSPIPQFIGHISYSLYLVHATVLFALVHALHQQLSLFSLFPIYLLLSFAVATIFYQLIERPSMSAGRTLAALIARERPTAVGKVQPVHERTSIKTPE